MSKLLVGDADSLISLTYQNDASYDKTAKISKAILDKGYDVIYPITAVIEAITTLKRALNLAAEAHLLNNQYQKGVFNIEYINEEITILASQIFDKAVSKQNTLFDAIVAATAKKLEADGIFSFDGWYQKLGFKLAQDLV